MTRRVVGLLASISLVTVAVARQPEPTRASERDYLSWPVPRAETIAERAYVRGRVGGMFDGRWLKTERAYNYKLAATLLTPTVIGMNLSRL